MMSISPCDPTNACDRVRVCDVLYGHASGHAYDHGDVFPVKCFIMKQILLTKAVYCILRSSRLDHQLILVLLWAKLCASSWVSISFSQ